MKNNLLSVAIDKLKEKKYDGYFLSISNEHLYEFTRTINNYIIEMTGFTGDTGALLITRKNSYLYVDGRFTIQAKKEINDKRIKIVEVNRNHKKIDDIIDRLGNNVKLAINPKRESSDFVLNMIDRLKVNDGRLVLDDTFMSKEFKETKKNHFNLSSAPLFSLDNKYVGYGAKYKIKNCLNAIKEMKGLKGNFSYVTSKLEEIAYLTNLRYRFCDLDNHGVLFDAFLIVNAKKSLLYIRDYLDDKAERYIRKSDIIIKDYNEFYRDLKEINNKNRYFFDKSINNYCIYNILKVKDDSNVINSPLELEMSIKNGTEIKNLRSCNILDGVAITKAIYKIKHTNFKNSELNNEYRIKKFIDDLRVAIGKKEYLCQSFETIVAYKENAAICHYAPSEDRNKKISNNSLLLIDSGGNYLKGTTDITRTISLYKKKIPLILKKHYSLVLDSMLNLSMLKFPYGLCGYELDIIARKRLYDEYLDFNHGTGHGIGYISNVHEGPNRIGPGITRHYEKNVLEPYQVTSNEPGLYFENKYGIRIENDLLTVELKDNEFGSFLGFETLTLCPYDRDLIDKRYLSKDSITFLNNYNHIVYKKLSKYLSTEEKNWLKKETKEL